MNDRFSQIETLLKSGRDSQTVLEESLRLVLTTLNSETGTIHRLDPEKQLLQLVTQVGLPSFMLDIVNTIPVGKGIAGETVVRNSPVTICNLQTDRSGVARPAARQTGVGGALSVPIRKAGQVIGTVGVGTKREHEYTADETAKLEAVADVIGELGLS